MKKAKPIRAWAIKKDNKLNALNIFIEKEVSLTKGEKMVRVVISEI